MSNNLVNDSSSVFTTVSRYVNPTIPAITVTETAQNYFVISLSSAIETSPGQTIAIDWHIVN